MAAARLQLVITEEGGSEGSCNKFDGKTLRLAVNGEDWSGVLRTLTAVWV